MREKLTDEEHYKREYNFLKDVHYRKGEILRLEYINAKHCREIERDDKKIKNLELELSIRDIPRMKESLKSSAQLAIKQLREIERLSAINDEKDKSIGKCLRRIDEHLQDKARLTIDSNLKSGYIKDLESKLSTRKEDSGATEETTIFKDFYLFARQLILTTYLDVNRDEVDLEYMKSAFRYMLPCLGDPRALLSENEKHKIELADSVLHKFGIETMAKYEELVMRGDIDIQIVDRRIKVRVDFGPCGIITMTSPGDLGGKGD